MEAIQLVKSAEGCSGCGACAAVCPVHAVTMAPAADGCLYPQIDQNKCICCEKCIHVCEEKNKQNLNHPAEAYAAVGQAEQLIKNSASGGVYACIARSHLLSGGMTAGAVMDCSGTGIHVYHMLSDKMEDLQKMQGSKYVQSDAWRCYDDVISALKKGKRVLFSGTPCQAAAIKQLTGDPENLITMDLVCHGVPPLQMLADYAKILEKRFGGKLQNLNFRDKSSGKSFYARWDILKVKKIKEYRLSSRLQSYYRYFLSGVTYRESCYACPYAQMNRVSDITIGDYWKIEDMHAADFASRRMEKRSDWSCILVNTQKGNDFLREHASVVKLFPSKAEWIAVGNGQLNAPIQKPSNRAEVLKLYREGGYAAVEADFIQKSGGRLCYFWRTFKNLHANKKRCSQSKESK